MFCRVSIPSTTGHMFSLWGRLIVSFAGGRFNPLYHGAYVLTTRPQAEPLQLALFQSPLPRGICSHSSDYMWELYPLQVSIPSTTGHMFSRFGPDLCQRSPRVSIPSTTGHM